MWPIGQHILLYSNLYKNTKVYNVYANIMIHKTTNCNINFSVIKIIGPREKLFGPMSWASKDYFAQNSFLSMIMKN